MTVNTRPGRLLREGNIRCDLCSNRTRCISHGLKAEGQIAFDALIELLHPLKRAEALVNQGDSFHNLYIVRTGSLKKIVTQAGARDQVTHFFLPGELVGLECIGGGVCSGSIVALETTFVCELPLMHVEKLLHESCSLRNHLFSSMGDEMRNDQRMMCLLSGLTADQRLASFFLEFSERFRIRGYSPYYFNLSMSRADIGSYLGLAIETVSRVLGRFQKRELIAIEGRRVTLLSLEKLKELSEEGCGRHSGY